MIRREPIKKWILTASIDGDSIDFETILYSAEEPGFWECYGIAQANRCDYFSVCEMVD